MKTKPIEYMHAVFGLGPQGVTCQGCRNLCFHRRDRIWYKCLVWGESSCSASDWRISWPACGMYNKLCPSGMNKIKDVVKSRQGRRLMTEVLMEIPGQISMFEGEER